MEKFVQRLDNFVKTINEADNIIIGAGSGLSTAAGIEYTGKRFEDNFKDYIDEYGFTDLYSSGFYPFKTSEEKWAYWARHIAINRFDVGETEVYTKLHQLVKDKDYFVLTTNVESQFMINRFDTNRIFATQGDYGLLQCSKPCHNKLYNNEKQVREWIVKTKDFKIPTELIPKCPLCGSEMDINLRKNDKFVEDEKWMMMRKNYEDFLSRIDGKLALLEIGVGFNTPSIIRYPFEQITYNSNNTTLIRINKEYADAITENKDKTISFDEDVLEILNYYLSRI